MPKQPRRKSASSRPGPKPLRPTKRQRHAVEVGVAIGMTGEQIATALAMSRWSLYAHFKDEISSGRAKRMLANGVRLDQAASEGSVPAMKYLHALMMDHGAEAEADDDWADVVGPISTQNPEAEKMN